MPRRRRDVPTVFPFGDENRPPIQAFRGDRRRLARLSLAIVVCGVAVFLFASLAAVITR